jgi:hypothetical protein
MFSNNTAEQKIVKQIFEQNVEQKRPRFARHLNHSDELIDHSG